MKEFCDRVLVPCLIEVCSVPEDQARPVGADVLARAEAFARLDEQYADVLIVAFAEETFSHEPRDAPPTLKATATFVIRNSALETYHASGQVADATVRFLTTKGAGPLSHLIAARRQSPPVEGPSRYRGLDSRYPRAWAALSKLLDIFAEGGRGGYRPPTAPLPALPNIGEVVSTRTVGKEGAPIEVAVMDAMEPGLDQRMYDLMRSIDAGELRRLMVSALSRLSRNIEKQLRIVEFVLSRHADILTTNCLLRDGEVWLRRGALVKPSSNDPMANLVTLKGLSGTHRKAVEALAAQFKSARDSGTP